MDKIYPFDRTYDLLGKSLNIAARRHSLITGNIANMDTIGYQPRDLDFDKTLQRAMNSGGGELYKTHPDHMEQRSEKRIYQGKPRENSGDPHNLDRVNIDTEMTSLISNNGKYKTSVEMLLRKIAILRQSINEGGN
ncbi:MAG: flagellar basal body rod protein FlgB [Desulfobacteraceae bacterium]|nr:MAG: flagellar basal body rod protein FlgB [Desulfobacteraceae bacterium]